MQDIRQPVNNVQWGVNSWRIGQWVAPWIMDPRRLSSPVVPRCRGDRDDAEDDPVEGPRDEGGYGQPADHAQPYPQEGADEPALGRVNARPALE
jgi:hypothetical protein